MLFKNPGINCKKTIVTMVLRAGKAENKSCNRMATCYRFSFKDSQFHMFISLILSLTFELVLTVLNYTSYCVDDGHLVRGQNSTLFLHRLPKLLSLPKDNPLH